MAREDYTEELKIGPLPMWKAIALTFLYTVASIMGAVTFVGVSRYWEAFFGFIAFWNGATMFILIVIYILRMK